MLKKLVGFAWKFTPYLARVRIIRLTQTKFTASVAAIVTNKEEKILLLDHILRPYWSWGIPGGFIENGEQPEIAVKRELFEETGLELKNVRMISVRTIKRHIEMMFRADADGEIKIKTNEIAGGDWFEIDKMPDNMSRAQKSLIEKVLKKGV